MLFDYIIPYPTWSFEEFIPSYSFFCPEAIFWIQHFRRNYRGTQEELLEEAEFFFKYTKAWEDYLEKHLAKRLAEKMKALLS